MRALRVWILCSVGVGAVTLLCAYLNAAESKPAADKAPDLQQRVTTLEAKVAELEKRLAAQPTPAYPMATPGIATLPGQGPAPLLSPAPSGLPPNAVPHEFNGQTYYILPLGKKAGQ